MSRFCPTKRNSAFSCFAKNSLSIVRHPQNRVDSLARFRADTLRARENARKARPLWNAAFSEKSALRRANALFSGSLPAKGALDLQARG
jgi:hypothetical protein